MDEVDTLIARYRAVGPNRDGTLDGLLANIKDPRVPEFVLAIVENRQEDFLARISVLRRFEHFVPHDTVLAQKLRKVFLDIVSGVADAGKSQGTLWGYVPRISYQEQQRLLRTYAVSALNSQCQLKEVMDVLIPILMNPLESQSVREAAFYAVVNSAPWPEREPMVRAMLNDKDLAETARIELAYRNRK